MEHQTTAFEMYSKLQLLKENIETRKLMKCNSIKAKEKMNKLNDNSWKG